MEKCCVVVRIGMVQVVIIMVLNIIKILGLYLFVIDILKKSKTNFYFLFKRFPLAVKLGTINADIETIDVHSYSEELHGEKGFCFRLF